MHKMVFLQVGAMTAATAIAAFFFGLSGAISAALAGLAVVVPSGLFALRLSLASKRGGAPTAAGFIVGEVVKIAAMVGLLALIGARYEGLHWGAFFIGLIVTLKANLLAFWVKT